MKGVSISTLVIAYAVVTFFICLASYLSWLSHPFDIGSREFDITLGLMGDWPWVNLIHLIGFLILAFLYAIIVHRKENVPHRALIFIVALFFFAVPWISLDVMFYLSKGWQTFQYGLNPYTSSIDEISGHELDPIFSSMVPILKWLKGNYGPLFHLLSVGVAALSLGVPQLGLLLFKAIMTLSILACYWIILRLIEDTSNTLFSLKWVLLSPVILFNFICAAHNDALLMALILCGILFVFRDQLLITGFLIGLSVVFKLVAVFLIPPIVVYLFLKYRWGVFSRTGLLCGGIATGAFIHLCVDWNAYEFLKEIVHYPYSIYRTSIYSFIGRTVWLDTLSTPTLGKIIFVLLTGPLILLNAYLLKKKPTEFLLLTCFEVLLLVVLLVLPSINEWYLLWPMCFAFAALHFKGVHRWVIGVNFVFMPLVIFTIFSSSFEKNYTVVLASQFLIVSGMLFTGVMYFYTKFRSIWEGKLELE